jgi:hypothetical protein
MSPNPNQNPDDMQRLGTLAMDFRGTKCDPDRRRIAQEYSATVERLIDSGNWEEMPAPEDQLPDNWMPRKFFDYWFQRYGVR